MTTAAPVDFSFAGRYGVMEGWWTFDTMCSAFAFTRTVSSMLLPSEPGAPFGQRWMDWGAAAAEPISTVPRNSAAHIRRQLRFPICNFKHSVSRVFPTLKLLTEGLLARSTLGN